MKSALFSMFGRSDLRRLVSVATLVLVLISSLGVDRGVGGGVRAAWADLADQHYKKALAFYEAKDYPRAIREFQAAYKVRQLPRILLNIGQVYRKLGMASTALKFYEHYLRVEPNAKPEIKVEVDRYIAQTKAMLDPPEIVALPAKSAAAAAAEAVATAPSDISPVAVPEYYTTDGEAAPQPVRAPGRGKVAPTGGTEPLLPKVSPTARGWESGTSLAPPPDGSRGNVGSGLVTAHPPGGEPANKPVYQKPWFWGVLSAVAVTAIVAGVVAGETQHSSLPATILYPSK